MSEYHQIDVQFADRELLEIALKEWADQSGRQFESHRSPVNLYGFQGDERAEKAHMVIRRYHVSRSANDLGFLVNGDKITVIISEFDQSNKGAEIVKALKAGYARAGVKARARSLGYDAQEIKEQGQTRYILTPIKRRQSRRQQVGRRA